MAGKHRSPRHRLVIVDERAGNEREANARLKALLLMTLPVCGFRVVESEELRSVPRDNGGETIARLLPEFDRLTEGCE